MSASTTSLSGPLADNGEAIEALLFSAAAGDEGELSGQDEGGSWMVQARPSDTGGAIIRFEIANNTAIWAEGLEDVDGNLPLWGEFEMNESSHQAMDRLIDLESESHRLAYLVGADSSSTER